MNLRLIGLAVLVLPVAWLASCSGGSPGAARLSQPSCGSSSKFCLVSCNLGCQVTGTCAVTSIAQNQPIELIFSDLIDPSSVTSGAASLKTANGESPSGRYVVSGAKLQFIPEVRISGGVTTFGFRAGATYILSLSASATGGVLRSVSGDRLARSVVCSLQVTQGLVDLDGKPPEAELILPTTTTGVPRNTAIVLRFSELIDVSSFNGTSTIASPIIYQIRRTVPDPSDPNARLCDPSFAPVLIQGVPIASVEGTSPPRTVISLQPSTELPNRVCAEITLTSQVRDLAGNSAARKTFLFYTETGVIVQQEITESFANETRLDRTVSGGHWTAGVATPARFGGRGIHGSFSHTIGTLQPGTLNTFVINTNSVTIPVDRTLFQTQNITVTDGQFEFTDLVVPAGIKVVFVGPRAPLLRVSGIVQIDGELSCDGTSPAPNFPPTGLPNQLVPGQAGGQGGAGGGSGGQGADSCTGAVTPPPAANSGRPGENLRAPANSGYASLVTGTGGRGGPVYPASGLDSSVVYSFFSTICGMLSGGGAGASFLGSGTAGVAVNSFVTTGPMDLGPPSVPGNTVPFTALPPGRSTLEHFLVGGAGGGGGASIPLNMLSSDITSGRNWNAGAGAGGGGGAMAIRVGHAFGVDAAGILSARGAPGANQTNANMSFGSASPGGGGSGGSLVVQLVELGNLSQAGRIDISGGASSRSQTTRVTNLAVMTGGAGGYGQVRFEADGPITTAQLGTVVGPVSPPAGFVGMLDPTESDANSLCMSLWRTSRQLFAPLWVHYRMVVKVRGLDVVYSDNPAEFNPADRDTEPVRIWFQGGTVNATSSQLEGEPGPWRNYINGQNGRASLNIDGVTGLRFLIVFNRSVESDVLIEDLAITFEG